MIHHELSKMIWVWLTLAAVPSQLLTHKMHCNPATRGDKLHSTWQNALAIYTHTVQWYSMLTYSRRTVKLLLFCDKQLWW